MVMLEDQIREVMRTQNLKAIDVYKPLGINRVNFYKAIKSSNLDNKTLIKIIDFLKCEISIELRGTNDNKQ